MIADLNAAGFSVQRISELVSISHAYRDAVPVLLKWLEVGRSDSVTEEIVRALTDTRARPLAAGALLRKFVQLSGADQMHLKWAVGNALSTVATDEVFEDIADVIADQQHGRGREQLLAALPRMKDPRRVGVAVAALADAQLVGHAAEAIKRMRPPEALEPLRSRRNGTTGWVRQEIDAAIAATEKVAL